MVLSNWDASCHDNSRTKKKKKKKKIKNQIIPI